MFHLAAKPHNQEMAAGSWSLACRGYVSLSAATQLSPVTISCTEKEVVQYR